MVESPPNGEVLPDQDLQFGNVPVNGGFGGGVEVALADLPYGLDAKILKGLLMLLRDDVIGDGNHRSFTAVAANHRWRSRRTSCSASTSSPIGVSGQVREGKRVVLVGDDPSAVLLTQAERQPQAVVGVVSQLFRSATAQQGIGEGNIVTSR